MRPYDIFSAILLILSIIDITLAAPVLVREDRQASVDVIHIPKDVVDVLGKRVVVKGAEKLAMVTLDYFKTMGKPVESSDAHASSSLAPPELDHGSTSVVQTPGPNPASSTTNPGPLKEPSSPSSIASSVKGVWGDTSLSSDRWSQSYEGNNELHDVALDTPPSPEHGSDQELPATWANWHAQPKPNPRPSVDSQFDWSYMEDPLPSPLRPASPKEAPKYQVGHVQQPSSGSPANSDFNWDYWMNLEDQAPSRLTTKLDSDPNLMAAHRPGPPTNTRLTTKLDSDPNLMAAYQPPTNSRLTTKLDSDPNLMAAYLPPTNSRLTTKLDSDPNLMAAHQLPTSSRLTTKPDSGPNLMAYQSPTDSRLTTKLDSDPNLIAAHRPPFYLSPMVFDKTHDASPSSPYASSSTRVDPYSYPGSVAHLPSPGTGLPTVPEGDEGTLSSPGAEINSNHRTGLEGHPPVVPTRPADNAATQKESGQAHEDHVLQVLEPIPGSSADWKDIEHPPPKKSWKSLINWKNWANPDPLTPKAKLALSKPSKPKPSTKSGVNWKYWVNPLNLMDPLTPEGRLRLASPRPLNTRPSSNTGPPNTGPSNPGSSNPRPSTPTPSNPGPSNPGSSNPGPSNPWPLNPRPLRIQEPKIDDKSSSTDLPAAGSQSMDPQAALYAVKGKGKELRRVSGTARDV